MSEKRIVVPEEMLVAASDALAKMKYPALRIELAGVALEAALLWLSENPIVPTDEQADELWRHPKVLSIYEHYAKAMARDWQRMMFLAPNPSAYARAARAIGAITLDREEGERIIEFVKGAIRG